MKIVVLNDHILSETICLFCVCVCLFVCVEVLHNSFNTIEIFAILLLNINN